MRIKWCVLIMIGTLLAPQALAVTPMADDEFLEMVAKDSFNYFIENANEVNGLVRDGSSANAPCSIASVGFALAAYCIGAENKWISKNEALNRCLVVLETFRDKVPSE